MRMRMVLVLDQGEADQEIVQQEDAGEYQFSALHCQHRTSQECQPFCAKERSPGSQRSDNRKQRDRTKAKRGAYELSESEAKTVLEKWSSALSRAWSHHKSNKYPCTISICHKISQSEAWWQSGDDTVLVTQPLKPQENTKG